jgi:regulator of protease activity HflC (stomatin/prohibitin superfamily)
MVLLSGCGAVIEPGHRGLVFDPRNGGLQHDVLGPGWHRLGVHARMDDFDVTFSTKHEDLRLLSSEGVPVNVSLAVIYRPIVSELADLDVEIGPHYYDEVIGPELRSTARAFFSHHSYLEVPKLTERLESEVPALVRKRVAGKHVEISSVTLENVSFLPGIAAALRPRMVSGDGCETLSNENDLLRRDLSQIRTGYY